MPSYSLEPLVCTRLRHTAMSTFALLSSLVCLGAAFGFISHRLLRLPTTVGTVILALALSGVLILANGFGSHLHSAAESLVGRIDFNEVVLHGMLAFLLFAGALHLNLPELSREKLAVLVLSTAGTVLSTALVAVLFRLTMELVGVHPRMLVCLLFGALISPTDPIAVLEMLRRVGAPRTLETLLAGESLFNDGVGAVIFLALLSASATGALPSPAHLAALLLLQAGGGVALGILLGYLTFRVLSLVENYRVEVMLTLALAMGGYALADAIHVSAPLEVIAAGILVNGRARAFAMSSKARADVGTFWDLVDEIMNVVLFLLLGLELLIVPMGRLHLLAGLVTIPVVLLSRWASVGMCLGALRLHKPHLPWSLTVLTWGGLRGGLSVALALSLPPGEGRSLALAITYIVVIFSIIVQGLTVGPLLRSLKLNPARTVAVPQ